MRYLILIFYSFACCCCNGQDISVYRNYRLNYRIINTNIFLYSNPQLLLNNKQYDQTSWFIQDVAENPLDPVAYSYESNKLLDMPQNVVLTNPPSTAEQIKQNILKYRRTKNF